MEDATQPRGRFVCVARLGDEPGANLLAARLRSDGIDSRVHRPAGPYRLSIGQMAVTEVWVMEDRVEEARLIVLDSDVRSVLAAVDADPVLTWAMPERLLALAVSGAVAAAVVLGALRVF